MARELGRLDRSKTPAGNLEFQDSGHVPSSGVNLVLSVQRDSQEGQIYHTQRLPGKYLKAWDTFVEAAPACGSPTSGSGQTILLSHMCLLQGIRLSIWVRGEVFTKETLLPDRV